MIGYIILIGIVIVGGAILLARRHKLPERGAKGGPPGSPLTREAPSADEPTPGVSVTAKVERAENADKKTPPA